MKINDYRAAVKRVSLETIIPGYGFEHDGAPHLLLKQPPAPPDAAPNAFMKVLDLQSSSVTEITRNTQVTPLNMEINIVPPIV